ncbi:unnamed protein product [Haemonchus placei]|uniref:DZF domain-containing protein n=1 Tax=Haemonchus placei TaxID=6290 RepID=A0A3P7V7G8_HAEPC|nr:unnamed protein product [Haemonchus placei]
MTGNTVADIVIIMQTLPTSSSTEGRLIIFFNNFQIIILFETIYPELLYWLLVVSCVSRDYGCLLAAANAQVRILITTLPSNAPNLEPDLHLAERVMMINHHALRHVVWFEESSFKVSELGFCDILAIDVRLLSRCFIWLPLLQVLDLGIFLPGSPTLFDPTEPGMRIAYDLSFEDMVSLLFPVFCYTF